MFGMPDVSFVNMPPAPAANIRATRCAASASCTTAASHACSTSCTPRSSRLDDAGAPGPGAVRARLRHHFAPIVGQQVTLDRRQRRGVGAAHRPADRPRPHRFVLVDDPQARECDLVVKGIVAGQARGYLLDAASGAVPQRPRRRAAAHRRRAARPGRRRGQELTYTCAPPGSGLRARHRSRRGRLLRPRRARRRLRSGRPGRRAHRRLCRRLRRRRHHLGRRSHSQRPHRPRPRARRRLPHHRSR